jgi:uncharacterized protein (TIGR02217 family)
MAFIESPRFPDCIARGAQGGPEWNTVVVVSQSGAEIRNSSWTYPRHRWDVAFGVKTRIDFEALRAFFMAARGRLKSWRFKDHTDYSATHTTGVVTGLTSTTFQMFKRYASGSLNVDRIIKKPVSGTVEVRVSGAVVTATVATTTGILTIASAPAAANVTWSGEFDVPMRFDTDRLQARIEDVNTSKGLLHVWDSIPIVEDKTA